MKTICIVLLAAFALSFVLCLIAIPLLKKLKAGQYILGYVKEHKNKGGTPTMGGLAFVCAAVASSLIFCGTGDGAVNLTLVITSGYALVGFLDDFLKIYRKDNLGLKPYQKIIFQCSIAAIAAIYCYKNNLTQINIPFTDIKLNISYGIIPVVIFVFLATVNCVNLTDGLDGLAGGTSAAYLVFIGIILYMQGVSFYVLPFAMAGALAAFLVFNTNKASVFMGDTGSLALGSFISCVSVFSSDTLYIPIIGIVFVISGISVILQVIYYKRTRRRIFLMAPFHHHLQMKGFAESKIAYAYFAVTSLLGIVCIIFV
ncbi:MAG: phospho-N-acetylmuramoyl-pentapeptide-transferase [Clostridia bacterium]|nr:phospho-N-acetylmuramoyl-pentapeptide-transferase [Clostridia bacterium]